MLGTKSCGPDGKAGACECAPSGACTASSLTVTGPLNNSAGTAIVYSGQKATTVVGHKLDIDIEEDGCIAKLEFEVRLNTGGCTLRVTFGSIPGQSFGGLTSVQLVADSACPGFLDGDGEDTYTLVDSIPRGFGPFWYGKLGRVSERMAYGACVGRTSIEFPDRVLILRGQTTKLDLRVNLGDLVVAGDLFSTGDTELSCVRSIECGKGYHDGGNGWCVASGCADGYHDGGDGKSCFKAGACASGNHDDGMGLCIDDCAGGLHDDGKGECVPNGMCASGYHDDGVGTCVASGCAGGYRYNGNALCVPIVTCATGYKDNGIAVCVTTGCAAAYHNGGDGSCTANGTCSSGYHDNGLGTCVASGCGKGYHDNGLGTCVTNGCASGYHDNGLGACVASGCANGYHDGGAGACVANSTCALGYHASKTGGNRSPAGGHAAMASDSTA